LRPTWARPGRERAKVNALSPSASFKNRHILLTFTRASRLITKALRIGTAWISDNGEAEAEGEFAGLFFTHRDWRRRIIANQNAPQTCPPLCVNTTK
jgi:hypothetical protein